jgi:hypothetical protein
MPFPPRNQFSERAQREILAATQRVQTSFSSPKVVVVNRAFGSSVQLPYYCQPSTNCNGATGTFPTGNSNGSYAMSSFVANVYQASNGALSKVATNATVFNPYGATVVASKTCRVTPDGTGDYYVDAESCT